MLHQSHNVARTFIATFRGRVIGFFSLASDCVSLNKEDLNEHKIPFRYLEYPALKIARFGVASDLHRQGIGTYLLKQIVGMALELQEKVGLRFVSVDAYRKKVDFYYKFGFIKNLAEPPNSHDVSLRYDLEPIIWTGSPEPAKTEQ